MEENVLDIVCQFFIGSTDFNGICVNQLMTECQTDIGKVKEVLERLVQQQKVSLIFSSSPVTPLLNYWRIYPLISS